MPKKYSQNAGADTLPRARDAFERNDFAACEQLCRETLGKTPQHAEALTLLGMAAVKTRQLELALDVLPKAALANRRDARAHVYLSAAMLMLNRNDDALASTGRALKLKPGDTLTTLTLNIRACVLGNLNRNQESLQACDQALKIKPDYVEVLVNRGNALVQLKRPEEALDSFERARQIKPDFAPAINNCATLLTQLKRFGEALQRYDEALKLQPDYAEAAFSRGVMLSDLGRPRESLKSYLHALEIRPDYLDARCNLAFCRLQLGDFAQGWKDYEAQWEKSKLAGRQPTFRQPLWTGAEPLRGKTLLLYADEGLGDTIQFCRYAQKAKARGARVVLLVQRPLLKLLKGIKGADKVVVKGGRVPKTDYHCPLMKLPGAFKTEMESIPADIPYLRSDPLLVTRWRKRIRSPSKKNRLRIGLAWSGNPAHANDHNRSLALTDILPLLAFDAEWVSLQKEVRVSDAAVLAQQPQIKHFGEQIKDFSDTAALVEQMDLVIAVDTSVAHLAGAMGKAVWILLPSNPDWRWLLKRSDNPWYPTARLFRQPAPGDWASAISLVRKALGKQQRL